MFVNQWGKVLKMVSQKLKDFVAVEWWLNLVVVFNHLVHHLCWFIILYWRSCSSWTNVYDKLLTNPGLSSTYYHSHYFCGSFPILNISMQQANVAAKVLCSMLSCLFPNSTILYLSACRSWCMSLWMAQGEFIFSNWWAIDVTLQYMYTLELLRQRLKLDLRSQYQFGQMCVNASDFWPLCVTGSISAGHTCYVRTSRIKKKAETGALNPVCRTDSHITCIMWSTHSLASQLETIGNPERSQTQQHKARCAASVAQWFSAVDFRRRRWRMAVGSSPIHGRWHAVQRPLISPRLLANAR